jgi:hypothetical protein
VGLQNLEAKTADTTYLNGKEEMKSKQQLIVAGQN